MNNTFLKKTSDLLDLSRVSFGFGLGSALSQPVTNMPRREAVDEALNGLHRLRAVPKFRKTAQCLTFAVQHFVDALNAESPLERHRIIKRGSAMLKRLLRRSPAQKGPPGDSSAKVSRQDPGFWLDCAAFRCEMAYRYANGSFGEYAVNSFRTALIEITSAAAQINTGLAEGKLDRN